MDDLSQLDPDVLYAFKIIGVIALLLWLFGLFSRRRRIFYRIRGIFWALQRIYWDIKRSIRYIRNLILGFFQPSRRHYFRRRRTIVQKNIEYRSLAEIDNPIIPEPTEKNFKPWSVDYLMAFALWAVGFIWLVYALIQYRQTQDIKFSALGMFCVLPIYLGFSWFECGHSRKRGKAVELEAKEKLKALLPTDWAILQTHLLDNIGDIDVAFRFPHGEVCVAEIKSWNYWTGFVRKAKALRQVRRQARAIGADYPIIWLPKAQTLYQEFHGDVFVVSGPPRLLLQRAESIIMHDAIVQFPREPSLDARNLIKSLGFMWNPTSYRWHGKCCGLEAVKLQVQISKDKGRIFLTKAQGSEFEDWHE